MNKQVYGTIGFLDVIKLKLVWEKQKEDPTTFAGKVKSALNKDRSIKLLSGAHYSERQTTAVAAMTSERPMPTFAKSFVV